MRDYIILNGVNSNTITGLLISTLPPITKPKIRTQTEEIDGRDGDIVTKLGYSAYNKEFEIGLYGDFNIDDVIAYFNTEGTVVFSNESDKYYNYQIIDQIDYEKLIRFKTAKVKMHVQPFKYPLEETPVEINIQNVSGEGEATDLDNTAEAPLTLALKGNTSQNGTPTPTTPVEVDTTTGGQNIAICGKNLFDKDNINLVGRYYINSSGTVLSSPYDKLLWVKLQPNTSYVITQPIKSDVTTRLAIFTAPPVLNSVGTVLATISSTTAIRNKITTTSTAIYLAWVYCNNNALGTHTEQEMLDCIQIEKGNNPTTYEPYQNQSYEINLGKNLANYELLFNNSSYYSISSNNELTVISNDVRTWAGMDGTTWGINLEAGTYTVCFNSNSNGQIQIYGKNSQQLTRTNLNNTTNATFTLNQKDIVVIKFINLTSYPYTAGKVQLEKGSTATTYAPYKTPIELCKIGDYQDRIYKDSGKWYIEKNIDKYTFTGQENASIVSSNSNGYLFQVSGKTFPSIENYSTNYLNNYSLANTTANTNSAPLGSYFYNNIYRLRLPSTTASTSEQFQTWLATANNTIYYPLATPTTIEIADQELITQLEAIKNARSYDPITHINQNTADKPFILNVTAVQKGSDTGVVDNEGNIYSKPTIDIEGTGTAEIYLNNNQIFSVDLSTYNECIIDTTNLEAYNPATSQLMNRQVTGDYSNFKLNAGENQVKISGAVTKATITNYTRWV